MAGGQFADLRARLFFLLGALVVFRIGAHVPVAGVDYASLQSAVAQGGGVLGLLNLFSGGALERASVMALGIFPYITASIIMMLGSYSLPWLEEMRKEGESGRKRITQYTRLFTVPLALFQSYGFAAGLEALEVVDSPGAGFRATAMVGMMGGSLFLMWLGEQITERGIGNGISLLIFASIVSGLPVAGGQLFEQVRLGTYGPFTVIFVLLFVAAALGAVVFVERGQRRVLINYARRQTGGGRMVGGQASYLPLKVNMGGVMPAIFAYAIITFPTTILAFSSAGGSEWLRDLSAYIQRGTPLYFLALGSTIFFFAFFFVSLVYNARDNSDMLRKGGAFIPGIRPGEQTLSYLEKIVSRLTLIGACYITTVCLVPEMLFSNLDIAAIFGGTSVLIMVVVSMDFMEQVQHYMLTHQYGSLLKNMPGGGAAAGRRG
ncbi:MAG: preprotein translocase subunit SecY [Gammaproteobacteria bacterium]